jgi:hypothetical protein
MFGIELGPTNVPDNGGEAADAVSARCCLDAFSGGVGGVLDFLSGASVITGAAALICGIIWMNIRGDGELSDIGLIAEKPKG